MEFKVGDKVIPRKFSSNNNEGVTYNKYNMDKFIGKECEITQLYDFGYQLDYGYTWIESALEQLEPQNYFYVGQTVYSPLFRNKEGKGVVVDINISWNCPVKCKYDEVEVYFLLDGRYLDKHDFVSLFQEPIQFPVNKPIERFEEGEIVEVSDDGEIWSLAYFKGVNPSQVYPYEVYTNKDIGVLKNTFKFSTFKFSKIRKIK